MSGVCLIERSLNMWSLGNDGRFSSSQGLMLCHPPASVGISMWGSATTGTAPQY